jgi:hypothetical protein
VNFDNLSFLTGFFFGFLVSGVIGYMLNRINLARNAMRAPDRPMSVPTGNTPRTVLANAARAGQTCMTWSIALLLFIVVVIALLYMLLGY